MLLKRAKGESGVVSGEPRSASQDEGQTARTSTTDDASTRLLKERLKPGPFCTQEKVAVLSHPQGKDGEQSALMKVMDEAPTGRWRRLIVTQHGIPSQPRGVRERSAQRSRGSHDPEGADGRAISRAKGHRWSDRSCHAGREMRSARVAQKVTCCSATRWTAGERSDTETVTLREARGDGKRAMAQWSLACRLLT